MVVHRDAARGTVPWFLSTYCTAQHYRNALHHRAVLHHAGRTTMLYPDKRSSASANSTRIVQRCLLETDRTCGDPIGRWPPTSNHKHITKRSDSSDSGMIVNIYRNFRWRPLLRRCVSEGHLNSFIYTHFFPQWVNASPFVRCFAIHAQHNRGNSA